MPGGLEKCRSKAPSSWYCQPQVNLELTWADVCMQYHGNSHFISEGQVLYRFIYLISKSDLFCFQLAFSSREHPLAAAPVCHAEGSHSGVFSGGEGGPSCPGTLFRRVGPHTPDCSPRQDPAGPLLQNIRGESLCSCFVNRSKWSDTEKTGTWKYSNIRRGLSYVDFT